MQINYSMVHQNTRIASTLNTDEKEPFFEKTWDSLFENAQKNHLPYYIAASVLVKDESSYRTIFYDGVALRKYLKINELDPQTELKIEKVTYLFLNCYDYSETEQDPDVLSLPLNPTPSPEYISESCLSELTQNDELSDILFDSLTPSHGTKSDEKRIYDLSTRQLIIGNHLIETGHRLTGLRWIWCAAENGLSVAQKALGIYALDVNNEFGLEPSTEEAEFWLQSAADQGDVQASSLVKNLKIALDQQLSSY